MVKEAKANSRLSNNLLLIILVVLILLIIGLIIGIVVGNINKNDARWSGDALSSGSGQSSQTTDSDESDAELAEIGEEYNISGDLLSTVYGMDTDEAIAYLDTEQANNTDENIDIRIQLAKVQVYIWGERYEDAESLLSQLDVDKMNPYQKKDYYELYEKVEAALGNEEKSKEMNEKFKEQYDEIFGGGMAYNPNTDRIYNIGLEYRRS